MTGALRIGVSARLGKTAVAGLGNKDPNEVELIWPRTRENVQPVARLYTRTGEDISHSFPDLTRCSPSTVRSMESC